MRNLLLVLAASGTLATGVQAQTSLTCTADAPGEQSCRDVTGNMFHLHSDTAAASGRSGEAAPESGGRPGAVMLRRPDGSIIQGQSDGLGNAIFYDSDGRMIHCRIGASVPGGQAGMDCQ